MRYSIFESIMRWLRGAKIKESRFANRPAWLRDELLDKAAAKRKMRMDKRMRLAQRRMGKA
jgi:hypothetical protein